MAETDPKPASTPAPPARDAQPYEVWAVFSSEVSTHIAGFLITDRCRMPALICFVDGCDPVSMLASKLISTGKRSLKMRWTCGAVPSPILFWASR